MTSETFSRYRCWDQSRIGNVINVEATAVDRPTFLATHTPMQTIRYEKSPRQAENASERALLEDLQAAAAEDRHTFVVIKGIPGTGKSHLIRWLKDRYEEEKIQGTEQDIVLLIERSNSSLRGTLRQIVASGVFETAATRQHLDRLERASGALSRVALSDDLINAFQVAAVESDQGGEIEVRSIIAKRVSDFLLDPTVRRPLQAPGGPIDRIIHFVTEGRSDSLQPGDMPEFEADDFDFTIEVRREMQRDSNRKVIPLLNSLWSRPEIREELASYLNRLRSFAIGHTIQLSIEDVRLIFNDLRRDLRRRGKSLALFIEDITAFSGIDQGLIDVLATQHTGEGNREYCRILSVVGITDSYFQDQFPRNLQERVTHQLSLNTHGAASSTESDLLQQEQTLAALAARYLNAIRLSAATLEQWAQSGGFPEELPVACGSCSFREPCHSAFGNVDVGASTPVGLYPFNLNALSTMYRGLKNETRTPRSLLRDVLQYILNNHAPAISDGEFPPQPNQLASRYELPRIEVGHDTVISSQAPNDHRRVTSLVLYWGDGSVYSTGAEPDRRVGGLQEGVFRALEIPFIPGQPINELVTQIQPRPTQETKPESKKLDPVRTKVNRFAQEIRLWRDGERLNSYADPRNLAINALKTGIDWDIYGIPLSTVSDRLRANFVRIEGQAGYVSGDFVELSRTPIFADVLIAITDISELSSDLSDEVLTGHLYTIRTWIDAVSDEVVQFVRRPRRDVEVPLPILELFVIDSILLEWLSGNLSLQHADPEEMFLNLVASARAVGESNGFSQQWEARIERLRGTRDQAWTGLMRRIGAQRAAAIHSNLLQLLNAPQGTSPNVLFVDAPTALMMIERFLKAGWRLRPFDDIEGALPQYWEQGLSVYKTCQISVHDTLREESKRYAEELDTLEGFIGDESHGRVFEAIDELLARYSQYLIPHHFKKQPDLGAADLRSTMSVLRESTSQKTDTRRALAISGSASAYERAHNYHQYLDGFLQFARREEQGFSSFIQSAEQSTSTGQTLLEVEMFYRDLERKLQEACDKCIEQEAAG